METEAHCIITKHPHSVHCPGLHGPVEFFSLLIKQGKNKYETNIKQNFSGFPGHAGCFSIKNEENIKNMKYKKLKTYK